MKIKSRGAIVLRVLPSLKGFIMDLMLPTVRPGTGEDPVTWVYGSNLTGLDFSSPDVFCALLDMEKGLVTFSLATNDFGFDNPHLMNMMTGQGWGQISHLEEYTLRHQVDRLPSDPSVWPKTLTLYRYEPVLTLSGNLAKRTPRGVTGDTYQIPTTLAVALIAAERWHVLEAMQIKKVDQGPGGIQVEAVNGKGMELSLFIAKGTETYFYNSNGVLQRQVGKAIWAEYEGATMSLKKTFYSFSSFSN